jgi:inner membrane protein
MVVLPLALTALLLAWDRYVRRRRRAGARVPVRPRALLALAALGIWSHPLLDLLNTYGVRLLMPFSGRWFYGDTLFIVDPWLWPALTIGILVARWRARRADGPRQHAWATRPARVAIAAFSAYAVVMAASSRIGRIIVERQAPAGAGGAVRTMVAPVPLTPFRRTVVRDLGGAYEFGELAWLPTPRYAAAAPPVPTWSGSGGAADAADSAAIAAAARTRDGAAFLSWSRFPRFTSERGTDVVRVRMSDVRYADAGGRGWAAVVVDIPADTGERP